MFSTFLRYYHTLKFLQWTQIKHRLLYQIKPYTNNVEITESDLVKDKQLVFKDSIHSSNSWLGSSGFEFLNKQHHFGDQIDWNFSDYGKLWTYNLNYFEFLVQSKMSKYEGLGLIHDFISKEEEIRDGMEPFPISLRCIFWIRFLIIHQIKDAQIDRSLFRQLQLLSRRPEYHLLGNHLLENGFSLLFGACYFNNSTLFAQAKQILSIELEEQILSDGAHFELSPMYHQIILYRLLDSINLLEHNFKETEQELINKLRKKTTFMLGWLKQMSFSNGDLPNVNDSIPGIGPEVIKLFNYAERLNIHISHCTLGSSGYRKIRRSKYELLIDVGQIGPDYIPGHAHSDTFSFILYHKGQPLIVDTGISTYEKNKRRHQERSTSAHNTVMVNNLEQSEVWGGFRVARRAKVTQLEVKPEMISATHDGYKKINCLHQRSFLFKEDTFSIKDEISNKKEGMAFLHFQQDVTVHLQDNQLTGSFGNIQFDDHDRIQLEPYWLATGFNQTVKATRAIIFFRHQLSAKFLLK